MANRNTHRPHHRGSSMTAIALLFVLMATLCAVIINVQGHGYLSDPPQRSSVWRQFKVPDSAKNENDNGLFCGGFDTQFNMNQGKCGECGDAWNLPRPRPNDEGGRYGLGVIVRNYTRGALVPMKVTLTAAHMGYYEFRLCSEKKTANELVTQTCLDKNLLKLADGKTRSYLTTAVGVYTLLVQLPPAVTCNYCVIQWRYVDGNNWGTCVNGTSAVGCGPQETYQNCADVSIL